MDKETIPFETLNLIVSPCLCVKDGRIFRCNQAADPLMLFWPQAGKNTLPFGVEACT